MDTGKPETQKWDTPTAPQSTSLFSPKVEIK